MFTFIYQLYDLYHLHVVGLFLVFFVLSWSVYLIKLVKSSRYNYKTKYPMPDGIVHVIIPVVDEPIVIWRNVLVNLVDALRGTQSHITVVANGNNAVEETKLATEMGLEVVRNPIASKRLAIKAGVEADKNSKFTVILDSDTIVTKDSIINLLCAFNDPKVGGATPKHEIFNRTGTLYRRISDWLEDIRFNEVVKGQSVDGAVSCLPGRMLAIRTDLLKEALPALVNQTFLGNPCISGDDRFLTSWLLERNYKAVYVSDSLVKTNAPDTLEGFVKQRLRWSRTSLRESIRSLNWIFNYPFTALTVLSTIFFRWLYAVVILTAVLTWVGLIHRNHYLDLSIYQIFWYTVLGFLASGFIRQLRHFIKYPLDVVYLIPFLLVTTFVLTPVEWFGNLTLKESGWLTRKLEHADHK